MEYLIYSCAQKVCVFLGVLTLLSFFFLSTADFIICLGHNGTVSLFFCEPVFVSFRSCRW